MISLPRTSIHSGLRKIFISNLVACRRIAYVCFCRGSQLSGEIFHFPTFGVQGAARFWLFRRINNIFFLSLCWSRRRHSPNPLIFRPSPRKERSDSFREYRDSLILLIHAPTFKGNDIQRRRRYHWGGGQGTVLSSHSVDSRRSWCFGSNFFSFVIIWRVGVGNVVCLDDRKVQKLVQWILMTQFSFNFLFYFKKLNFTVP